MSQDIYPTERRGFTTRAYTANPKISDFSVPKEVYNFRTPSPGIKTNGLTGQVNVDMDKARTLFIPTVNTSGQAKSPNRGPNWTMAQKLFAPKASESKETKQPVDIGKMGQSGQTNPEPDWNLARKLFIPDLGNRRK